MTDPGRLQEVIDRQEIIDCTLRYCRGVDRLDRDLLLSAYHENAVDYHGSFVGTPEAFADWVFEHQRATMHSHQHMVLNQTVELDGDIAHGETYYFVATTRSDEAILTLSGGRYVDRFERRNGNWRIASRVCVREWKTQVEPLRADPALDLFAHGVRDRTDVSYRRPLDAVHEAATRHNNEGNEE